MAIVFTTRNIGRDIFAGLKGMDLAQVVTVSDSYNWTAGEWDLDSNTASEPGEQSHHVVAYDFGVKRNILRLLSDLDCRLTVVPATTPAEEVLSYIDWEGQTAQDRVIIQGRRTELPAECVALPFVPGTARKAIAEFL